MNQDLVDLHWEAVKLVDTLYRRNINRPKLIQRALKRARRRFDKAWPGVMTLNEGKQWGRKAEGDNGVIGC